MLLAGDIGGTKTNLAVFSPEAGPRNPVAEATFPSADYPSLEAIVRAFLGHHHLAVERATFGVAGPVVEGNAEITNLSWTVNEGHLRNTLGLASLRLINDLQAIGYAIPALEPGEVHTLQAGRAVPGGTIAVIAAGTGLGEAFLTWNGQTYKTYASEGGHTDFGPTSTFEFGLLRSLQERFGHVSYERVCSGKGFPNIYHYIKDIDFAPEPVWLAAKLAEADDPTPLLIAAALDKDHPCELCQVALQTFISILGAETGNLALKVLATGGVYLGGGIPPRILPQLSDGSFIKSFRTKGRFYDLMSQMPVHVILNPKVALLGAACHVFGGEDA